jgi:nitrous oxide reductase
MKNLVSFNLFEGKAEKAAKNPYGNKTKEDKKDQLRKSVEDHIKTKDCKAKQVGDDLEIHCDGEHIGQVMFRTNEITVKNIYGFRKFGKEFKYDQLGKIKAEITSIIKDYSK